MVRRSIALAAGTVYKTRWSQILAQNRDFSLSHLHPTPPSGWGGSCRNIVMTFGIGKLEWCGYPTDSRLDRIHERDRQTDTA